MTSWWRKGPLMPNYVTQEHFDGTIANVRSEFNARLDDIMTTLDGMATILVRLDQERLFTIERVRRIEDDVTMVKKHLKLA
ncbi:MAG: hypothetical protein V1838_01825 [Patescibacteria group bacterium]